MLERQKQLLHLLIQSQAAISAADLSKELKVSRKTIYKDLEILRSSASKYHIQIESIPSSGIQLNAPNQEALNQLLEEYHTDIQNDLYSVENRRLYIIRRLMLSDELVTLEALSAKFIISKTSLYNDIKKINEIILGFQVKLLSTKNGLIIEGEELDIQKSLIEIIFTLMNDSYEATFESVYYDLFDQDIVDAIYHQFFNVHQSLTQSVSEYYIQSLLSALIILCSRLRLSKHLKVVNTDYKAIVSVEEEAVALELIEALSQSLDITFTKADQNYLNNQLFAHRLIDWEKKVTDQIKDITQRFVQKMSEIEGVDFSQDPELLESLYYHISSMITRLKLGVHIQNPLLNSLKEEYGVLFSVCWYAVSIFEESFQVRMNDDEVSLLLIPFQINLEKNRHAHRIVIVCQYGISSAQLIYSRIKRFIPDQDDIQLCTLESLKDLDLESVDLLISSIDLPALEIPSVKVKPTISSQDYINIITAYTRYLTNNLEVEASDGSGEINSLLLKYLRQDLIDLSVEMEDKNQLLANIADELIAKGLVSPAYKESLIEREAMGSTSLASGIALPHANPNTVNESHIAIYVIKDGMMWNGVEVFLVVVTNFKDDDVADIHDIINYLYQKMDAKEKVQAMKDADSKIELMSQLIE